MEKRKQFFFDESGKSDLSSSEKSGQENLIVAGILVSESGFWDDVKRAWKHAAELLSIAPSEIELHGWELYGGKGGWSNAPNALPVLKIIFSSLKKHNIPIYWTGLPVERLKIIQDKPWEHVLAHYLKLLHGKFSKLEFKNPVEVYGDANSWVQPQKALTMDSWRLFENNQVGFVSSADVYGIQIADIVAHTLYRSNKSILSNTDKTANNFRIQISGQFYHLH